MIKRFDNFLNESKSEIEDVIKKTDTYKNINKYSLKDYIEFFNDLDDELQNMYNGKDKYYKIAYDLLYDYFRNKDNTNETDDIENTKDIDNKYYSVGDLIEKLQQYDKKIPVKYTLGGSGNYDSISYVKKHNNSIIIGKLTW